MFRAVWFCAFQFSLSFVLIAFCFDCVLSFAFRPSSFGGFAFRNSLRFERPNLYAFCVLVSETHTYLNSLAFRPSAFWF